MAAHFSPEVRIGKFRSIGTVVLSSSASPSRVEVLEQESHATAFSPHPECYNGNESFSAFSCMKDSLPLQKMGQGIGVRPSSSLVILLFEERQRGQHSYHSTH